MTALPHRQATFTDTQSEEEIAFLNSSVRICFLSHKYDRPKPVLTLVNDGAKLEV